MAEEPWLPGSFTKNYSWGSGAGLLPLYEAIQVGFAGTLQPVTRATFRARIANLHRPDFIPLNFFLFNFVQDGIDFLAVDELVFQAITADHSERFDKLALFAFNFGYAGKWKGIKRGQRYPTLWAKHYIIERVAKVFYWDTRKISADDIEMFLRSKPQYEAQTFRKVSTNLAYLYRIGDLKGYAAPRIERWWVDALFLALDRLIADRRLDGVQTGNETLPNLLLNSHFRELTGPTSSEKTFAMAHLLSLYTICGESRRFEAGAVEDRIAVELPDYYVPAPNDPRPQGAVHPTNPRILKSIPRQCAPLAERAGFRIVYADDLEQFDPRDFVQRQTREAIDSLRRDGIKSELSAEELHKMTRQN